MTLDSGPLERKAEIFSRACELTDQERAAYLRVACEADHTLRGEIESMLDARRRQGGFLEHPTGVLLRASLTAGIENGATGAESTPGRHIGPYKLLQPIGEGGFGTVYMAEQETPVRRMVALKILKPGMDTKQVIARFEAERQALALSLPIEPASSRRHLRMQPHRRG